MGTASTAPNAPSLVWGTIGTGHRHYVYDSTHINVEIRTDGFITDGQSLGMLLGDTMVATGSTTYSAEFNVVTAVSSTGVTLKQSTHGDARDSRFVYLEDFYDGETYWDDAFTRAFAAMGSAGAFGGPTQRLILPHTGNVALKISQPLTLGLNTQIEGDGGQWGSIIDCEDIADTEDGAIKFGADGSGFIHGIKLQNFQLSNLKVHGIFCDVKWAENGMIDMLTFTPHTDYEHLVDGIHWAGTEGSTPVNFGHIHGFSLRYVVYSETLHRRTAATIQSVNGDNNKAWVYATGSGGPGVLHIGKIKAEINTDSDSVVEALSGASVHVDDLWVTNLVNTPQKTTKGIVNISTGGGVPPDVRVRNFMQNDSNTDLWKYGLTYAQPNGVYRRDIYLSPTQFRQLTLDVPDGKIFDAPIETGIINSNRKSQIFDEFRSANIDTVLWDEDWGSAGATAAKIGRNRGVLRLTTANDAGLTPALNGHIITLTEKVYDGDRINFWFDIFSLTSFIVFIGATNLQATGGTPIRPFEAQSGTVTKDAGVTDGGGLLIDPRSDTPAQWIMVGADGGTLANSSAESPLDTMWNMVGPNALFDVGISISGTTMDVFVRGGWAGQLTGVEGTGLYPCIAIDRTAQGVSGLLDLDTFRAIMAKQATA